MIKRNKKLQVNKKVYHGKKRSKNYNSLMIE